MFGNWDIQLFQAINKQFSGHVLDAFMYWITRLGSGEFIFLVALLMILWPRKENKTAGILLLAGLTVSYHFSGFIKELVARPRPFETIQGTIIVETAKSFSFPSTHTTMAFMAAVIIAVCFKKRLLAYTLALLVGLSRIYLGVHYPTDVIGGAMAGLIIGFLLVRTMECIEIEGESE